MGIFHSKIAPIDKTQNQFSNSVDPRSPTININRSPIGAEQTVPDKPIITKVRDLTADLTEILDNAQTPDRGAVSEKLQSVLDPRSPSAFLRTPLVLLDESNASNISLRGSSIEYEEIDDSEGDLSFKDCSANISTAPVMGSIGGSGSIFSDTSLNTELKADIDCIIQKLYDAGSNKDPRSPSVAILRTPIVLQDTEECAKEEQSESPVEDEQPLVVSQQGTKDDVHDEEEEKTTTTKLTMVLQDENTYTPSAAMAVTPKREKSDLSARKTGGVRTPLGCVTNVQQTLANAAANDMRKTALLGQLKQSATTGLGNSAELIPGKKVQPRSKIPTFRMK